MLARCVVLVAVAISVVVLFDMTGTVEAQNSRCRLDGELYNKNRQIGRGGIIRAECPHPFPLLRIHSAPFGNWGVGSAFGKKKDGDQFRGWYPDGRQRHWNSCTTHPDFQAPNTRYYNVPPNVGWSQEGEQTRELVNSLKEIFRRPGAGGQSCRDRWNGVPVTLNDLKMKLYELDPGGRDELVATLNYGNVGIKLSCSSTWTCEGESPWMQPQSVDPPSSGVSAKAYVLLKTVREVRR